MNNCQNVQKVQTWSGLKMTNEEDQNRRRQRRRLVRGFSLNKRNCMLNLDFFAKIEVNIICAGLLGTTGQGE